MGAFRRRFRVPLWTLAAEPAKSPMPAPTIVNDLDEISYRIAGLRSCCRVL
jgi:hypothetical protein